MSLSVNGGKPSSQFRRDMLVSEDAAAQIQQLSRQWVFHRTSGELEWQRLMCLLKAQVYGRLGTLERVSPSSEENPRWQGQEIAILIMEIAGGRLGTPQQVSSRISTLERSASFHDQKVIALAVQMLLLLLGEAIKFFYGMFMSSFPPPETIE